MLDVEKHLQKSTYGSLLLYDSNHSPAAIQRDHEGNFEGNRFTLFRSGDTKGSQIVSRIYPAGAKWTQHYYMITIIRHKTLIVVIINDTADCLNKTW